MAAYATQVAEAIVTILAALPGAPALVEWRKTDVLHPKRDDGGGDPDNAIIVSGGPERIIDRAFEGTAKTEYPFQVSVYAATTPNVTADDTRPALLQAAKQALSVTTLSGVPAVWDYEIADRSEWEGQPFRDGVEVSRFGVLYRTAEPTNG